MIALFCSALLSLFSGLFVIAPLRWSSRAGALLMVSGVAAAHVVLTSRLAGALNRLNEPGAWLLLQLGLTVLAAAWWWWRGRPALRWRSPWPEARRVWRSSRALRFVAIFLALGYAVVLWQTIAMPSIEFDSNTYRLPRVNYWLQHENFLPWLSHNPRQVIFPHNAEIGSLWTVVMLGHAQGTATLTWVIALLTGVGVYALTRQLGYRPTASAFTALMWLSLPGVFFQAGSVQNDLPMAWFALIAVYGLYEGVKTKRAAPFALSALGVGLMVGTKATAAFYLPGLALVGLILWLGRPRQRLRLLAWWAVASVLMVGVFGLYSYVQTWQVYGSLSGPGDFVEGEAVFSSDPLRQLGINAPRYLSLMIEPMGLPNLVSIPLYQARNEAVRALFADSPILTDNTWGRLQSDYQSYMAAPQAKSEMRAWFGPLGALILLPGLIYGVWRAWRGRDAYFLGLVLLFVSFWLIHSALQPWTGGKGRYYLLPAATAAPLMAWVMGTQGWLIGVRWLAVTLILIITPSLALDNYLKPVIREPNVISRDFLERRVLREPELVPTLRAIEEHVPPTARLGVIEPSTINNVDYHFIGPAMDRDLIFVFPGDETAPLTDWASSALRAFPLGVPPDYERVPPDYWLIHAARWSQVSDTEGFTLLAHTAPYRLFKRDPDPVGESTNPCVLVGERLCALPGRPRRDRPYTDSPTSSDPSVPPGR